MMTVRYLADTNLFIQCKALESLPWDLLTNATDIDIHPAPTAITEIDRQKGDPGKRRAKRARATASLFKKIIVSNAPLTIRESGPRVTLHLPPPLTDSARAEVAKFGEPDQRIVEEALLLRETLPGLVVLSHDTGTLMRARERAMDFALIPEDWLADPEPDALERRVASLERDIEDMRQSAPQLNVALASADNTGVLHLEKLSFSALSDSEVDAAIERIMAPDHEQVARMQASIGQIRLLRPMHTQESVDKHCEDLKVWAGELREKVAQANKYANIAYALMPASLIIANNGAVPAEHLRVSIRAQGTLRLATEYALEVLWEVEADEFAAARARNAPRFDVAKPSWRKRYRSPLDPDYMSQVWRTPAFDATPARFARDSYEFHRVSDEDDKEIFVEEIVFECDDFRHGLAPVHVPFAVFAPPEAGTSSLTVQLSAKRGEPLQRTFRVEHMVREGELGPIAENMVAGLMAKLEDDKDD